DVIKVRQIMLVQVVKEERGTKGAALTTYLSLAGRYCVLMPNTARGGGISRKITNVSDRKRLREIAGELDVPRGMGLIVRTAGAERTRAEIRRDYEFLLRQWERVRDLTLKSIAPTLIYEEGSLIKRSIRDLYSREIEQVLVEGEAGYREAKEYMRVLMPSHARNVQPYSDTIPLFSRYQVESYLNGMFSPKVPLKSGGYLVIGITEALVAIDVNSGRATKQSSIEETALHTNLEAAEEVARQLRLRDLAGLIVIDFIDMDEGRNNRAVEKRLKEKLKSDRARIQIGRISAFGLLEMSRQRLRPGMLEATTRPCPHCHGSGLIRSDDSLALAILREVEEEALRGRTNEINVHAPVEIANYLVNIKRQHIAQIEARSQISVMVTADPDLISPDYEIERCKGERKQPAPAARDVISASAMAMPEVAEVPEEADAASGSASPAGERDERQGGDDDRSRRRRGRRGGRRRRADSSESRDQQQADENPDTDAEQKSAGAGASANTGDEQQAAESGREQNGSEEERGRSRRGRGRRRRGRRNDEQQQNAARADAGDGDAAREGATSDTGQKPAAAHAAPDDATAASTEAGDVEIVAPGSAPEAAENADAPDTTQPADAAPALELQAGDGSTAAAEQDAEGTSLGTENAGAGGMPQDDGVPAQSAASPADEAHAHETAPQQVADEAAPAKADEPIELHAGDGSTAAAGQDLESAASGNAETSDADAPAKITDHQEAADGKGSENEQGAQQTDATEARSAPEPAEEKAPQPKRRGWWSLGL
ncbi:MAG TPA: Rne/Rng family ribonuclease, partial [Paracoccaceae bacterium]|nr:Rne/Rng family ribonuclease [Paracoccaceae bacterium]